MSKTLIKKKKKSNKCELNAAVGAQQHLLLLSVFKKCLSKMVDKKIGLKTPRPLSAVDCCSGQSEGHTGETAGDTFRDKRKTESM